MRQSRIPSAAASFQVTARACSASVTSQRAALVTIILALSVLPPSRSEAQPVAGGAPGSSLHNDSKGFFRILPPEGWKITDYRDDPRGKVAFRGPEQVELRVLASDWEMTDADAFFAQLSANTAEVEAKIGVRVQLTHEQLLGREVVRRSFTYQGLRTTAFMFLPGTIKHDLQYAAPEAAYRRFEPMAMAAISTYEPLAPASARAAKDQELANKLDRRSGVRARSFRQAPARDDVWTMRVQDRHRCPRGKAPSDERLPSVIGATSVAFTEGSKCEVIPLPASTGARRDGKKARGSDGIRAKYQ